VTCMTLERLQLNFLHGHACGDLGELLILLAHPDPGVREIIPLRTYAKFINWNGHDSGPPLAVLTGISGFFVALHWAQSRHLAPSGSGSR
jgi:hypothetical protein